MRVSRVEESLRILRRGVAGAREGESLYGESSFSLGKLKGPGDGQDDGDGLYLQLMSCAL